MLFHYFALTRPLVVDTTQVQDAVNYNTFKFSHIIATNKLGISFHRIERYEHIATQQLSARVIERDYIGKIVVLKILQIDLENLRVITEYISKLADNLSMKACDLEDPVL